MKVYFSVSISQSSARVKENSQKILSYIELLGYSQLHENVMLKDPQYYLNQSEAERLKEQHLLTLWKRRADVVILEVTNPSLGIGQELAYSLTLNKPVIALYDKKSGKPPHILVDQGKELLIVEGYREDNLFSILKGALSFAAEFQDVRFNMFISRDMNNYLNRVSRLQKVPKSIFLRNLVMGHMNENSGK